MINRFDTDTTLTRTGSSSFAGRLERGWWVERGPNGGYLAAILLRTLTMTIDNPEYAPCSLTVQYLEPATEPAIQIVTTVERSGRSMTMVSGRMFQEGRLLAIALSAFSRPRTSVTLVNATMPVVAAPDELSPFPPPAMSFPPFTSQFDYRWAIGDLPFSGSQHAEVGGWLRFKEPRLVDSLLVAAFADAWIPSVFPRLKQPAPVPTVDLTIHFRTRLPLPDAKPADFTLAVFRSRLAAEGLFEEDGELWSQNGVLIAHSRQLALLPPVQN